MAGSDQRTEQPTQRRLEQSRKDGQFLTSRELVAAAQFLAFVSVIVATGSQWFEALRIHFTSLVARSATLTLDPLITFQLIREAVWTYLKPFAFVFGALTLVPLALHLALTQFGFSTKRLQPDFSRLNPWSRLKDMPSNNLASLARAALILPLLLYAVYRVAEVEMVRVPGLPRMALGSSLGLILESIKNLLWKAASVWCC